MSLAHLMAVICAWAWAGRPLVVLSRGWCKTRGRFLTRRGTLFDFF